MGVDIEVRWKDGAMDRRGCYPADHRPYSTIDLFPERRYPNGCWRRVDEDLGGRLLDLEYTLSHDSHGEDHVSIHDAIFIGQILGIMRVAPEVEIRVSS